MNTPTLTPRNFLAHVAITAKNPTRAMQSALHQSVSEFLAVTALHADIDSPLQNFEPSQGNPWMQPGYAAAVAYTPDSTTPDETHPYTLATYVEGDVTRYRFPRHEDAARAGRLWAAGLI